MYKPRSQYCCALNTKLAFKMYSIIFPSFKSFTREGKKKYFQKHFFYSLEMKNPVKTKAFHMCNVASTPRSQYMSKSIQKSGPYSMCSIWLLKLVKLSFSKLLIIWNNCFGKWFTVEAGRVLNQNGVNVMKAQTCIMTPCTRCHFLMKVQYINVIYK